MSLLDSIRDIGISLAPNLIVGCEYSFGAVFSGKKLLVRGVIVRLIEDRGEVIRYEVSYKEISEVTIIGLVKIDDEWMLHLEGDKSFTLYLPGNFEIV